MNRRFDSLFSRWSPATALAITTQNTCGYKLICIKDQPPGLCTTVTVVYSVLLAYTTIPIILKGFWLFFDSAQIFLTIKCRVAKNSDVFYQKCLFNLTVFELFIN